MLWISRTRGTRIAAACASSRVTASSSAGSTWTTTSVSGSARSTAASTASAAAWPCPTAASGATAITTSAKYLPAAERMRSRRSVTVGSSAAIACRTASSASAGARSISTSTFRRMSRRAAESTSTATNRAATESASGQPSRTPISPISTASEPAKSLPKCNALDRSAALWKRLPVRSDVSVRETSIASTSRITRNAHQVASTWISIQPASRATASPATPTLTIASTPASKRAARCSAFPWPYWCCSSAGLPATPTAKNVSSAATRSVPEWSASETRPSEPLAMPAVSLSASSASAAATEMSAVRRWGLTG